MNRAYGPDGQTIPLDGSDGITMLAGPSGRAMPEFALTTRTTLTQHGVLLEQVRVEPRTVDIPLLCAGPWAARDQLRRLLKVLNPLRGNSRFVVDWPDGQSRELVGRIEDGDVDETVANADHQLLTLQVFCPDPFWRDATDQQVVFVAGLPDFFPWWPYQIAGSSIIGDVQIANDGDVEAWPVWRILGPGGPFVATRADGATLTLDTVLGPGEQVVIDTRPPGLSSTPKSVTGPAGENFYDRIAATDELFAIPPGIQDVTIEFEDATDDSRVYLAYRRRSFTP